MPGAGPLTGRRFIEMAFEATDTNPDIGVLGRGFLKLVGLFAPDARELIELMYEFEEPLVLDGSRFASAFTSFQYTPHEEGIRHTVEWFRQLSTI